VAEKGRLWANCYLWRVFSRGGERFIGAWGAAFGRGLLLAALAAALHVLRTAHGPLPPPRCWLRLLRVCAGLSDYLLVPGTFNMAWISFCVSLTASIHSLPQLPLRGIYGGAKLAASATLPLPPTWRTTCQLPGRRRTDGKDGRAWAARRTGWRRQTAAAGHNVAGVCRHGGARVLLFVPLRTIALLYASSVVDRLVRTPLRRRLPDPTHYAIS